MPKPLSVPAAEHPVEQPVVVGVAPLSAAAPSREDAMFDLLREPAVDAETEAWVRAASDRMFARLSAKHGLALADNDESSGEFFSAIGS